MSLQEEAKRIRQRQALKSRAQYIRYRSIGPTDESQREMADVIRQAHYVAACGDSCSYILHLVLMMVHGKHQAEHNWSRNLTLLERSRYFKVHRVRLYYYQLLAFAHQVVCGCDGCIPREYG